MVTVLSESCAKTMCCENTNKLVMIIVFRIDFIFIYLILKNFGLFLLQNKKLDFAIL